MKTNYEEIANKYSYHHALGGNDTSGGLEQNKVEMLMFCGLLQEKKIKTILEIGLAQGHFSKFLEECGLEVTGITKDETLLRYKPTVIWIGDSKKYTQIGEFDLVFVDGDHSYEGVKADYERYKGKCKFMAFHDILGLRDCEGVRKLWHEVRGKDFVQFIDPGDRNAASGIGVIEIKKEKKVVPQPPKSKPPKIQVYTGSPTVIKGKQKAKKGRPKKK